MWYPADVKPIKGIKVILLFEFGVCSWGWYNHDSNEWMFDEGNAGQPIWWTYAPLGYKTP